MDENTPAKVRKRDLRPKSKGKIFHPFSEGVAGSPLPSKSGFSPSRTSRDGEPDDAGHSTSPNERTPSNEAGQSGPPTKTTSFVIIVSVSRFLLCRFPSLSILALLVQHTTLLFSSNAQPSCACLVLSSFLGRVCAALSSVGSWPLLRCCRAPTVFPTPPSHPTPSRN